MTFVALGRVVGLVTERATARLFRIGLEAIESQTGRLVPNPVADYVGDGTAFDQGDVLFGKLRPYLAKVWMAETDGAAVGDFHVYRPDPAKLAGEYLRYCLLAWTFLDPVASSVFGAKMPRANWGFIRNVPIFLPPLPEQRAIADFLDREMAQIETLIEHQLQLIELLRERRAAVVDRLVRGRDRSDLIDSGDPMIGLMPRTWTSVPLRRLAESLDARRIPLSAEERGARKGPYPYFGATSAIDSVDGYLFEEDLVLVAEDGFGLLFRSKPIAVAVSGHIWVNNHAHVLRPVGLPAKYLAGRIEVEDVRPHVTGSRQPKLTADRLMSIRLSIPPSLAEADRIAELIDKEADTIDTLIAETERFIELARERRSALITAAVTGEIDVRREVA